MKYLEEVFEFEGISITDPSWECTHRWQHKSVEDSIEFYGKEHEAEIRAWYDKFADVDIVMNGIMDVADGDEDHYPDACDKLYGLLSNLKNPPAFFADLDNGEDLYLMFGKWSNC